MTELLYYVYNATPVPWAEPSRPLRITPACVRRGPRLTVADGFARWLRAPAGRRSLEELLACLPALRRAGELPRAWVRELTRLRDRLRDGLPSMGELLHHAYRVFAVYLLVLLLVNLFFPDNLYAKGWSSSSGPRSGISSSSSFSSSARFHGFHFSDPGTRYDAFRHRPAFYHGRSYATSSRDRVYDAEGREHPALRFSFTDPQGGRRPVSSLLALTPELQLLDTGAIGCTPAVPGYQCLLGPGGVRVLDSLGRELLALRPSARLHGDARARTQSRLASLERAVAEHQRWLDWVRWAGGRPSRRAARRPPRWRRLPP